MEYTFLDNKFDKEASILPESDKINSFILKNSQAEIVKAIDFFTSEEKFMYVHGFLGTGKRQIINYVSEFLERDVITLEYYCKQSTVCDDILLNFIEKIEKNNLSKAVNINVKISTLATKFHQYVSSIKKPFVIILHSIDDVEENNRKLVNDTINGILENDNVKLIVSTKGLEQDVIGGTKFDRKIFVKAFSQEIFKAFVTSSNIKFSDKLLEEFYQFTRGYYYYTALSIKIIQAMDLSLAEFIEKIKLSGMSFDSFLSATYLNLIPQSIRNFFWFLIYVRHGVTLNALAVWDLYDDFSVNYLKTNLMIFESNETLYVQDYFLQNLDISIPEKVEIKLHKYIIRIYEKELKESLQTRSVMISRQALRSEIEYHRECIEKIKSGKKQADTETVEKTNMTVVEQEQPEIVESLDNKLKAAEAFIEKNNNTQAIETYLDILETENPQGRILNEIRHKLGALYVKIADYTRGEHYYELVEKFYINNDETINLNYLYYEMAELYHQMYKNDRAIETIKKVIYSVDTPKSLLVDACMELGNIYMDLNNATEAFSYYKKVLESIDDDITEEFLSELYFKFALANDEKGDINTAFEYYNKCLSLTNNKYKASAYSNLGSCYFENGNLSDAENCFKMAYDIEKSANNYEGIYYTSVNLAKILASYKSSKVYEYLSEAKISAEFLNEYSYIVEVSTALGDYFYNIPDKYENALSEYFNARNAAYNIPNFDISEIEARIKDMKLRMPEDRFKEIEKQYEQ